MTLPHHPVTRWAVRFSLCNVEVLETTQLHLNSKQFRPKTPDDGDLMRSWNRPTLTSWLVQKQFQSCRVVWNGLHTSVSAMTLHCDLITSSTRLWKFLLRKSKLFHYKNLQHPEQSENQQHLYILFFFMSTWVVNKRMYVCIKPS